MKTSQKFNMVTSDSEKTGGKAQRQSERQTSKKSLSKPRWYQGTLTFHMLATSCSNCPTQGLCKCKWTRACFVFVLPEFLESHTLVVSHPEEY